MSIRLPSPNALLLATMMTLGTVAPLAAQSIFDQLQTLGDATSELQHETNDGLNADGQQPDRGIDCSQTADPGLCEKIYGPKSANNAASTWQQLQGLFGQ